MAREVIQRGIYHNSSTVNVKCHAGIKHMSRLLQNILVVGKAIYEDKLAEEAT